MAGRWGNYSFPFVVITGVTLGLGMGLLETIWRPEHYESVSEIPVTTDGLLGGITSMFSHLFACELGRRVTLFRLAFPVSYFVFSGVEAALLFALLPRMIAERRPSVHETG